MQEVKYWLAFNRIPGLGTPQSKVEALRKAGVEVAERPADVVELVKRQL